MTYTDLTASLSPELVPRRSRMPLVQIRNLTIGYTPRGSQEPIVLIKDVSFDIGRSEIVGLVGESGSGKTQTARAILRMNSRPLRPLSGQILLDGTDLLALSDREAHRIRGQRVAMIFQDPRAALHPLLRVGDQVTRVFALHKRLPKAEAYAEALAMFQRVGIAGPERVARSYPHQLSGGMCQRVMIAMALGIHPDLLIADEPTTGLDVTIQAQILDLVRSIREEAGISVLLITHDLGVVAETCERVVVMYAGQVVEIAPVRELFTQPRHPYTLRLIQSAVSLVDQPLSVDLETLTGGANEFIVAGQRYRASIDDVADRSIDLLLVEVAPEHYVLCRSEQN